MKPSKNAFLGYTYQQCITFLILAKMDVEREIEEIEIEATVVNNFDDVRISIDTTLIYCQIKDIDNISHTDLIINNDFISINGKNHKLSDGVNLLFFKNISVVCNAQILGFPAYNISDVYIISLSRNEAETAVCRLYKNNEKRKFIMNSFFNGCLDKRQWHIKQKELPTINIYNIHLLEKTINVGKRLLEIEDILFVEGKPGVGKSHLVTCLAKEYKNSIIYRFWVSNQDKDKDERLIFNNFLTNISKELFHDYRYRTEDEIIEYLNNNKRTVIIDGLDHVENYRKNELEFYINFIDKLKGKCKTIVLSRPLKTEIKWAKQQLTNWNFEETELVLNELYHISDYHVGRNIYDITDGYPILVRFVTEHYKQYSELPLSVKLTGVENYYEEIISNANMINALSLFLSSHSYIMESEIPMFLEDEYSDIVKEFIKAYPYLFEIRLNRISLFHDSLNTFLRNKNIHYSTRSSKIKQIVYKSLVNEEKRFMSRFAFFDLDKSMKLEIIKKYASINCFQRIMNECVDFEAIRAFYMQIREVLSDLDANNFDINHYYSLSLIINITMRDHVSTLNKFLYTYVKSLLFNGYCDNDITSSEHLFGMYYYCRTKDATLLYNLATDKHYDTTRFYQELKYDIWMEENYFERHQKPFRKTKQLNSFLNKELMSEIYEYIPHLLANLYLHETNIEELKELQVSVRTYIDVNETFGISLLERVLSNFSNANINLSRLYLKNAYDIILSLGKNTLINEYQTDNLKNFILNNSRHGSFIVWPKVRDYIRLSLYEKRKIDLSSINIFWTMYYNRKDYTVLNINEALKVFEDKGLINIDKSIDIIIHTQKMSEKGIRGLLTNYIELHTPEIIPYILKKYHPDNLQIVWFDLPAEFINHYSNGLFDYAMNFQLLRRNTYNKEIDFKDIQNVFYSNRKKDLIETLKFSKYHIRITENHSEIQALQKSGCLLSIHLPEKENEYNSTVEEKYAQGILDSDSIDFIKAKKLKVTEIAGYGDGNYSTFADLGIFNAYDKKIVKENTLLILRNALTGKVGTVNMFANLFHFPGNIPKFMDEFNVKTDFNILYDSFMKFLKISLLDVEEKIN